MTTALDVLGLAALAIAGFLIGLWLGFAVMGTGCLWVSYSMTARARRAREAETARRLRAVA